MQFHEIVLAAYPQGLPSPSDFALRKGRYAPLADGEVLVESLYWACDPGLRHRLSVADNYTAPVAIGARITGFTVGRVLESRSAAWAPGDRVLGQWGWCDKAVLPGAQLQPAPEHVGHPTHALLSYLGVPGATAYFGMHEVGRVQAGDRVLVTSAAGAVGAIACQLAKQRGAHVVGVAGGEEKTAWLRRLGVDAVIDHRACATRADLQAAIAAQFPQGMDLLFDTLGNAWVDLALPLMAPRGRLVLCGNTMDANLPMQERHPIRNLRALITQQLRIEGLLVLNYRQRFPEAWEHLKAMHASGQLHVEHAISSGLQALPQAFCSLFCGNPLGRKIVASLNE